MKVARMAVRMFVAEPPFAKVHLLGDPGVHHPLKRAIDRRPADARVFATDQFHQFVSGEMALLTQEDLDNDVTFAGAPSPGGAQLLDKFLGGLHGPTVRLTR